MLNLLYIVVIGEVNHHFSRPIQVLNNSSKVLCVCVAPSRSLCPLLLRVQKTPIVFYLVLELIWKTFPISAGLLNFNLSIFNLDHFSWHLLGNSFMLGVFGFMLAIFRFKNRPWIFLFVSCKV